MKSNNDDPRFLLTVELWKAVLGFNKDITKLRKQIVEVRIGLFEAVTRRRIKRIEEEFIKLNSRLFYFEDLEIQDFRNYPLWPSLYNKTFEELTDNEKTIKGVKINNNKKFIENEFMLYWRLPVTEVPMKKPILQIIEIARKNLSILDDRIITRYSQADQLKAMTVSIVSVFIAVISILISFFANW